MANRTGTTSLVLDNLIIDLRKLSVKEKVNLWKRVAFDLSKPRRQRREVDITRIDSFTKDGEIALVPGKVLSNGSLSKKVTVAAFKFSDSAKVKVNSKGKAISIRELMKDNPKGKKVRIIG